MIARHRPAAGFTLIEVLAVLFLTSIVFGVALNFYVALSNQSRHASEATRGVRRAVSLLDRLARDFERAVLEKKPAHVDPLAHPWIFVAESTRGASGADQVRFVARRPMDYRSGGAVSDMAVVSYGLREGESGDDFELVRWSEPYVPADFDPDFPFDDDPGALLFAGGITHFALRFLSESGDWVEQWDSSQLIESSALPVAVEIEVALRSNEAEDGETPTQSYRRRVLLPVRPLDFETLLDPVAYAAIGGGEQEGEQDCELKVSDCVDLSLLTGGPVDNSGEGPAAGISGLLELSDQDRETVKLLAGGGLANMCWENFRATYAGHPAVNPQCR